MTRRRVGVENRKLVRRKPVEVRMRSHLVVLSWRPQVSMIAFASARERNPSRPRHSWQYLPLKLSATPFR